MDDNEDVLGTLAAAQQYVLDLQVLFYSLKTVTTPKTKEDEAQTTVEPKSHARTAADRWGAVSECESAALRRQVAELQGALAEEKHARERAEEQYQMAVDLLRKSYGQIVDDYLAATEQLHARTRQLEHALQAATVGTGAALPPLPAPHAAATATKRTSEQPEPELLHPAGHGVAPSSSAADGGDRARLSGACAVAAQSAVSARNDVGWAQGGNAEAAALGGPEAWEQRGQPGARSHSGGGAGSEERAGAVASVFAEEHGGQAGGGSGKAAAAAADALEQLRLHIEQLSAELLLSPVGSVAADPGSGSGSPVGPVAAGRGLESPPGGSPGPVLDRDGCTGETASRGGSTSPKMQPARRVHAATHVLASKHDRVGRVTTSLAATGRSLGPDAGASGLPEAAPLNTSSVHEVPDSGLGTDGLAAACAPAHTPHPWASAGTQHAAGALRVAGAASSTSQGPAASPSPASSPDIQATGSDISTPPSNYPPSVASAFSPASATPAAATAARACAPKTYTRIGPGAGLADSFPSGIHVLHSPLAAHGGVPAGCFSYYRVPVGIQQDTDQGHGTSATGSRYEQQPHNKITEAALAGAAGASPGCAAAREAPTHGSGGSASAEKKRKLAAEESPDPPARQSQGTASSSANTLRSSSRREVEQVRPLRRSASSPAERPSPRRSGRHAGAGLRSGGPTPPAVARRAAAAGAAAGGLMGGRSARSARVSLMGQRQSGAQQAALLAAQQLARPQGAEPHALPFGSLSGGAAGQMAAGAPGEHNRAGDGDANEAAAAGLSTTGGMSRPGSAAGPVHLATAARTGTSAPSPSTLASSRRTTTSSSGQPSPASHLPQSHHHPPHATATPRGSLPHDTSPLPARSSATGASSGASAVEAQAPGLGSAAASTRVPASGPSPLSTSSSPFSSSLHGLTSLVRGLRDRLAAMQVETDWQSEDEEDEETAVHARGVGLAGAGAEHGEEGGDCSEANGDSGSGGEAVEGESEAGGRGSVVRNLLHDLGDSRGADKQGGIGADVGSNDSGGQGIFGVQAGGGDSKGRVKGSALLVGGDERDGSSQSGGCLEGGEEYAGAAGEASWHRTPQRGSSTGHPQPHAGFVGAAAMGSSHSAVYGFTVMGRQPRGAVGPSGRPSGNGGVLRRVSGGGKEGEGLLARRWQAAPGAASDGDGLGVSMPGLHGASDSACMADSADTANGAKQPSQQGGSQGVTGQPVFRASVGLANGSAARPGKGGGQGSGHQGVSAGATKVTRAAPSSAAVYSQQQQHPSHGHSQPDHWTPSDQSGPRKGIRRALHFPPDGDVGATPGPVGAGGGYPEATGLSGRGVAKGAAPGAGGGSGAGVYGSKAPQGASGVKAGARAVAGRGMAAAPGSTGPAGEVHAAAAGAGTQEPAGDLLDGDAGGQGLRSEAMFARIRQQLDELQSSFTQGLGQQQQPAGASVGAGSDRTHRRAAAGEGHT